MSDSDRLAEIAGIIEGVDNRCMAVDGPVSSTLSEMTQLELTRIYGLALGRTHKRKVKHDCDKKVRDRKAAKGCRIRTSAGKG